MGSSRAIRKIIYRCFTRHTFIVKVNARAIYVDRSARDGDCDGDCDGDIYLTAKYSLFLPATGKIIFGTFRESFSRVCNLTLIRCDVCFVMVIFI